MPSVRTRVNEPARPIGLGLVVDEIERNIGVQERALEDIVVVRCDDEGALGRGGLRVQPPGNLSEELMDAVWLVLTHEKRAKRLE